MSFRYIGSKARVVEQIAEHLGPPTGHFFVDAFCGTGAVAEVAASRGWRIRLNDHLVSATTMANARLLSTTDVRFEQLGGYRSVVDILNQTPPDYGFIWKEYSPASARRLKIERRYFTEKNAARIDGIRLQIQKWRADSLIDQNEETLLLADLLAATNRVANIAGTYGCFLAKWTPQSREQLLIRVRELKSRRTIIQTSNLDASQVSVGIDDVVYLDPPYTKRQYASYYHILETIRCGDKPKVEGVSGLRPWKDFASDYCYKKRALEALSKLIARVPARRIFLSYSNEGHVDLDKLWPLLKEIGETNMHELASVGRYRPNRRASATRSSVTEFLLEIKKERTAITVGQRRFAFA